MTLSKLCTQFSIRGLLVIVTLCGAGAAGWKAFLWEPPTHSILDYEKAQPSYGVAARVGPNVIRIESVARNDRNAKIRVQDGRGETRGTAINDRQTLVDCAKWLDVAQIELSPNGDLFEIRDGCFVRISPLEDRTPDR